VSILIQGGDDQVGIHDLDLLVTNDVTRGDNTFAGGVDVDDLGAIAIQLCGQSLEVQDDLSDIFLDTGDGRKLV
jgi:hypothetical protein